MINAKNLHCYFFRKKTILSMHILKGFSLSHFIKYKPCISGHNTSSVPEGNLMGVELIGVYKSGSINWG